MPLNILRTKDGRVSHLQLVQPPARRHVMRDGAAVRVTGWRFVLAVLAAVVVGVLVVMLAGRGVGR